MEEEWRVEKGEKGGDLRRRPVEHHYRYSTNSFTTFFFSIFSESHGKYEMLKLFQKWVRVKEVFIFKRLNRWGRRFGFVRFFDVGNVVSLKKELDCCFIGNMKLHVNLPKYRSERIKSNGNGHVSVEKSKSGGGIQYHNQNLQRKDKEVWREKGGKDVIRKDIAKQSYADVVRRPHNDPWRGHGFTTKVSILPWMVNSMVGRMMADCNFELLQEECIKGGMNMLRVFFLGQFR